jgi:hypothetical protein
VKFYYFDKYWEIQDGDQREETDSMSSVIKNLAEMLEQHLRGKKHLQHPKPQACRKIIHSALH